MDGELDERPGIMARPILNGFPCFANTDCRPSDLYLPAFAAPDTPFDQQFKVNRTGIVAIKAKGEGVFQPFEREMRSAARIRPIQKRTVLAAIRRLHHRAAHGSFIRVPFIGGEHANA